MLIAVFDTETTGLTKHCDVEPNQQPRIIEFAGIITDGNSILDEAEFRLNPQELLEPIITKITGLTDADLADAPVFSSCESTLSEFFGKTRAAITHNLSFDKGILTYELGRYGRSLSDIEFPKIEICSVEQTMPLFGRRMKLSELYERVMGTADQKHRAMDDVLMLHEVCKVYGIYKSTIEAHA